MLAKAKMEQICVLVTDGTHDSPKLQVSGVPFIKGKHISQGFVDFGTCDFISEKDHIEACRRVKPQAGDVLFSNIGSVGDTARVNVNREFSIKNVALFRPNPEIIDQRYFYYLVANPLFKESMLSLKSGSAQPFITLGSLRGYETTYHRCFSQQRRIATILSAYDDLIENNTRRIVILEEMARRVYEEWFVNFRFPGHESSCMVVSELGSVPDGWGLRALGDFGDVVTGKTPSKANANFYGGDVPFLKTPDMHGHVFVLAAGESLSNEGARSQANKLIAPRSLCVSCIGTIGVVSITVMPCHTNQQINSLVPSDPTVLEFLFFWLKGAKKSLENLGSNGATMGNVNKSKFESMKVLTPDSNLLRSFNAATAPMFDLIEMLARQNSNLRTTRDLLLPKLISGEFDVPEQLDQEEAAA